MKMRPSFSTQVAMGIFMALGIGALFQHAVGYQSETLPVSTATPPIPVQASSTPLAPPSPTLVPEPPRPTMTIPSLPTPRPFVTLPGAWLVRIRFFPDQPPEIVRILYLEEGRLTPSQPGDTALEMLDAQEMTLFRQTLQVVFFAGEPPHALDKVTALLVLPSIETATQIRIISPQGEITASLPVP